MDNGKTQKTRISDELKMSIKEEFVQGYLAEDDVRRYPSLDALSKRHEIGRATIYRYASKENWQKDKNEFLTKLERESTAARLKEALEHSHRLDHNALQLSHSLMGKVARALNQDEERTREDPDYRGLPAIALERFSIVLGNAQKIGKLALGEAQEISKVHADVTAPDSFSEIMEQLDELREQRAEKGGYVLQ
tara:strand:- start:4523 stop:5101 length:579 start_codon:yes stop_codon:yes gene_type:complete